MNVDVYDHVRAGADAPVPPGVYRVVGTDGAVTLLRVADPDGRRIHPGTVERIDRETVQALECADNPDAGLSASALFAPFDALGSAIRHWLGR